MFDHFDFSLPFLLAFNLASSYLTKLSQLGITSRTSEKGSSLRYNISLAF